MFLDTLRSRRLFSSLERVLTVQSGTLLSLLQKHGAWRFAKTANPLSIDLGSVLHDTGTRVARIWSLGAEVVVKISLWSTLIVLDAWTKKSRSSAVDA